MVGFATIGVISGIVIGIGGIRHAGDLHRAAVGGIGVVRAAAHLRDEGLKPPPLGHHGQTLVDVGVHFCFAVVCPGHALDLAVFLAERGVRCHAFAINFEILGGALLRCASHRVVTGDCVLCRKYQAAQLVRIHLSYTVLYVFDCIARQQPAHELPAVILAFRRMGYIGGDKQLRRVIFRCGARQCVHFARVSCKYRRFEAVHVRGFVGVIGSFHHIRFAAVGVVGDGGVFDEHKVQVGGGSQIIQIIGVNGIAGIIRGFDPFALFLFVCQAAGILNYVSCQLQKRGFRVAVFILRGVIHTDELTAGVGIRFLYNRLNLQRLAVGDIGGQLVIYGNRMTDVRCAPARRRSVTAADDGAAVGGGAAGQGMVELEVDVVQKVAEGFRLIRGGSGVHIAHRNKAEQRIRLAGRNGIQIILAQIHGGAAAAVVASRAALRVGAIGVPRVGAAGGPAAGHDPDVPLLGIDGAGGQAEGVVARIIFKRAVGGEFFAVNGVLLRFGPGGNGTVIYIQPVHHLHELIPARLVGLGGIHALLGADHQRHDIFAISRAMVKAPFVHAGRGGFHVLVQRAFLVRVQLGGVGAGCGFQGDARNIGAGILFEQLDLALKRRGIPGGNRALIRL